MMHEKLDRNNQTHEYEFQKDNFVIKVNANSPSIKALQRFQSSLLDILHSISSLKGEND